MVYSEKLLNIIALIKCEDHQTKKLIKVLPSNCLYLNKGNNSSVKGSILTKLIGYRESMVLIICTKNELNLTYRYWDMVPDRQKVWTDGRTEGRTDGMDGRTDRGMDDAKTISLRLCRGIINAIFRDWSTYLLGKSTWDPLKTDNGQSHPYCSYLYGKIHQNTKDFQESRKKTLQTR